MTPSSRELYLYHNTRLWQNLYLNKAATRKSTFYHYLSCKDYPDYKKHHIYFNLLFYFSRSLLGPKRQFLSNEHLLENCYELISKSHFLWDTTFLNSFSSSSTMLQKSFCNSSLIRSPSFSAVSLQFLDIHTFFLYTI